jgi:hypothetical protein
MINKPATTLPSRRDSELKVCDKMCDQCLYSKNKIVTDVRKDQILYQLEQVNDYFICHKASMVNERVMCRGYYEANKKTSLLIILGSQLKLLFFVDVVEIMRNAIHKSRHLQKIQAALKAQQREKRTRVRRNDAQ